MKEVKLLLKEELRKKLARQEHISKSYSVLNESKDDDLLSDYIKVSSDLINEGFELNEIDFILEQDQNLFSRLTNGLTSNFNADGIMDMGKNAWNNTNVAGAISGGLMSGLKERIILGILNFLGIGGTMVKDLVVLFNDYDIRTILSPFKNKEMCIKYAPNLIDSIIEVMLSHAMEKGVSNDIKSMTIAPSVAKVSLRNIFAQAEKQSNFGEIITEKFCSTVWE